MVAGEKVANKMSPWGIIKSEEIVARGRTQTAYTLFGIANLDYLRFIQMVYTTKTREL